MPVPKADEVVRAGMQSPGTPGKSAPRRAAWPALPCVALPAHGSTGVSDPPPPWRATAAALPVGVGVV